MTGIRAVYLIVCAAPPSHDVLTFVGMAVESGWDCHVIGTPSSKDFLNLSAIEEASGHSVTFEHRRPGEPKRGRPSADAAVIAPATANTINKLAVGIGENYALDLASELIGARVPMVIVPFVNTMLARRKPFTDAIGSLEQESVLVLENEQGARPHPRHKGPEHRAIFAWETAFTTIERTS
ncbi:hypothetical protein JQS30_06300 [Natronoglycomyces albus]|uniref:Flavoprotein domain-containing protein n=2 Tax=Natronoglycomyces albus TaxID=2811108 RepID=A0A895XLC9_9ACTN|nr:flavoprotein [Natronoglycomyces albus]QSB06511.1 hypothetical protein JQS30_06300 [Natronoglycomyces albus]